MRTNHQKGFVMLVTNESVPQKISIFANFVCHDVNIELADDEANSKRNGTCRGT